MNIAQRLQRDNSEMFDKVMKLKESPKIEHAEPNRIGLITQTEDGRIVQLGLTQSQSDALQLFVAAMSKEKPLVNLGPNYELEFKNNR